ncbi:hypothetical protein C8A05DRAFT_37615 [Staphylotrichum tortipilum]|uniref:Uncharacterized protein n=1 Tax=Staphylotrichum tortipilum TaxID=2831512 RepID=A0AAN6MF37_9PEZI|nr:hypothetical protein C8A05DRAFT_37615 [Staphylotrichum longicolle]
MLIASLTCLALALVGPALAQDPTDTGLNFASWSSHMSQFPLETYCPETAPNPMESQYEDCRSTAWDMVYRCPNGRTDASSRTICICSSIIAMSSCLTAYCPSNTVVASVLNNDQHDYTSIYNCPSRLGAAGGGGATATETGAGAGSTGAASPTYSDCVAANTASSKAQDECKTNIKSNAASSAASTSARKAAAMVAAGVFAALLQGARMSTATRDGMVEWGGN